MASGRDSSRRRRPRVLVVESDSQRAASIEDTLIALGHRYDVATNRCDARRMLKQRKYAYILLNLQIPARPHRGAASTVSAMMLLEDIRKSNGGGHVPTIVMAERDPAYFEMIGELVANGASEFVTLPFPKTGHTLLKAIRRVAERLDHPLQNGCGRFKPSKSNGKPVAFRGGEMVFFPIRVELCGVKICDGGGLMRTILDTLREKDPYGKFVSRSGEELADLIGSDGGPTAVAGAIRNFRNRVKRTMLMEANIAIDTTTDLIVNDRQRGYRLSEKITVTERAGLKAARKNGAKRNGVAHAIAAGPSPNHGAEMGDDARERWILAELKKTDGVRKCQIIQRTGWSDSTVRRALAKLRDEGRIVFEGSARSGCWRLA